MTVSLDILIELIKIISSVAIFFVWVVRYENIRKEFDDYNLPTWLRDLTGILKLSFAWMLHSSNPGMVVVGSSGITLFMLAAVATHVRLKSTFRRYIASVTMLLLSIAILYFSVA